MGGAIRRQCCGGRDNEDVKLKVEELQKESGSENDLALFSKAHESNDFELLVRLITSNQPFENNEAKIHPWAAAPRSVGALAVSQLASLASKDGELPCKDVIREAGAIPKLVELLKSKQQDKKHAAVIALSFLGDGNDENCVSMHQAGAMPLLVECMKEPPEDMKAAVASACRNIFVIGLIYRQEFVNCGGVAPLVALLELPSDGFDASKLHTQAEAVLYISDLITDQGAEELSQFEAPVKRAGAVAKLRALCDVKNQELSQDAHAVLIRLAD